MNENKTKSLNVFFKKNLYLSLIMVDVYNKVQMKMNVIKNMKSINDFQCWKYVDRGEHRRNFALLMGWKLEPNTTNNGFNENYSNKQKSNLYEIIEIYLLKHKRDYEKPTEKPKKRAFWFLFSSFMLQYRFRFVYHTFIHLVFVNKYLWTFSAKIVKLIVFNLEFLFRVFMSS